MELFRHFCILPAAGKDAIKDKRGPCRMGWQRDSAGTQNEAESYICKPQQFYGSLPGFEQVIFVKGPAN